MLTLGDADTATRLRNELRAIFKSTPGQETKTRRITFPGPAGPIKSPVTWLPDQRLWVAFPRAEPGTLFCWFGCSWPENDPIGADVEINFGTRRLGRALVDEEGRLHLGHRGGLGGGRGGQISILEFTRRIKGFEPQEISRPGRRDESIFVIGAIDDDNFLKSLRSYVGECVRLREEEKRRDLGLISPKEADEEPYDPTNAEDGREDVMRAIKTRRGQTTFRKALLEAYDRCCAITGCAVLDVLEAAHITPYLGPDTNNITNGILLRADLHTLFDLHLIAINPKNLQIIVHPRLRSSDYADLDGKKIARPSNRNAKPSEKALKQHLEDCKFED